MNDISMTKGIYGTTLAEKVARFVEASPPVSITEQAPAHVARDPSFSFNLRGDSLNPIVDASAPLLSLMLRTFSLGHHEQIDTLHKRIMHELEAIEIELHRLGYDRVSILAHRYCLCSALDEAVMCSPWGQDSNWSERSLLATFHNETWGGEKFFVILDRVMMEPNRYLHLIEFLYICLCLGYEGKYRVMHNGRLQLEAVIKEVHDAIRKVKGHPDPLALLKAEHIMDRLHHIAWRTPLTVVVGVAFLAALAVYFGFFFYLENHVDQGLAELQAVLGQ